VSALVFALSRSLVPVALAYSSHLIDWGWGQLLGRSSVDIDLAVDDMTGSAFATLLNQYLESIGYVCVCV
jgi:hypothetical protein